MVTAIAADEIVEFRSAVAGVEIDWVRTDQGWGAATMVSSGDDRAVVSTGGLDFSTLLHADVPDDRVALQLLTCAPHGLSWCGSEAHESDVHLFQPSMSMFGTVPAGSRAVTLVAWLEPLTQIADDLGVGELRYPAGSLRALPQTPELRLLVDDLRQIADEPTLLETPTGTVRLLEATARAISSVDTHERRNSGRGFSSKDIVAACVDHVKATGETQPTISELCRVAHASASRLRQAFVEVLGVPPIQYFQLRVLSMLRDELLAANPHESTVTRAASSLGLTQLGRVAGRYRVLFGESPRETLHRHELRRI